MKKIPAIVVLAFFLAPIGYFFWGLNSVGSDLDEESKFDQQRADVVVSLVSQGKLTTNRYGVIHLPNEYRGLTKLNRVTVTHVKDLTLIYFPTRYERVGAAGYLYCSRPIATSDTHIAFGNKCVSALSDVGDMTSSDPAAKTYGDMIDLPLKKMLSPHWWRIDGGAHEV